MGPNSLLPLSQYHYVYKSLMFQKLKLSSSNYLHNNIAVQNNIYYRSCLTAVMIFTLFLANIVSMCLSFFLSLELQINISNVAYSCLFCFILFYSYWSIFKNVICIFLYHLNQLNQSLKSTVAVNNQKKDCIIIERVFISRFCLQINF